MKILLRAVVVLIAVLASTFAANAQARRAELETACGNGRLQPQARLTACTSLISIVKKEIGKPSCGLSAFGAPPSPERRRGLCTDDTEQDLAKVYALRGAAQFYASNIANAVDDLSEAIRLDASVPHYYAGRAEVHKKAGNKREEIADYIRVVERMPEAYNVWNVICWELALLGEPERALPYCNTSLRLMYVPNTLDSRGLVHLKLGKFDKAIADYDAALSLKPNLAEALYGRAVARQRSGDRRGAEDDLRAALAIDPDIARKLGIEFKP